jgi:hypothetical protein
MTTSPYALCAKILIDTSLWIRVFRDKSGQESTYLQQWLSGRQVVLTRFQQLELLQGCKDEREWSLLHTYLDHQTYLETNKLTWPAAARIYYELRHQGLTVRSPIDCCIAQLAMENQCLLVHDDRDFDTIARVRPLQHSRLKATHNS